MDIPINDLMGAVATSTTSTVSSLSPVLIMVSGLLLAFFIIDIIIGLLKPKDKIMIDNYKNDIGGDEDESERRHNLYNKWRDKYGQEIADKKISKMGGF